MNRFKKYEFQGKGLYDVYDGNLCSTIAVFSAYQLFKKDGTAIYDDAVKLVNFIEEDESEIDSFILSPMSCDDKSNTKMDVEWICYANEKDDE